MALQTLGLTLPEKRSGNPLENPSVPLSTGGLMYLSGGHGTDAGPVVNDSSAMRQSSVFSCIRVLSQSIAGLPLRLLRVGPSGKKLEVASQLNSLLTISPNDEMSSFGLFMVAVAHLSLTGNAFVQVQRDGRGQPVGLWPLSPRETRPIRLPNNVLAYETQDGGVGRVLNAADTLHFRLETWDGILGISPIAMAANLIGGAIAADDYSAKVFRNGSVPMMVMTTDNKVKAEDKTLMRNDFETLQTNANQHRIAILDQGLKLEKLGISPEESQFLETKALSIQQISSIFRVPSFMLGGNSEKLTNSNLEQLRIDFVVNTIRPLAMALETEIRKKILLPVAPDLIVEFDMDSLTRGDKASTNTAIATARQWSLMTVNEGRHMQGLNPIDGPIGDSLLSPINMRIMGSNDPIPAPVDASASGTGSSTASATDTQTEVTDE